MKTGTELIAEERERQISKEGWTPEHDAEHTEGELLEAGMSYAHAVRYQYEAESLEVIKVHAQAKTIPWPWDIAWWKPSEDPIRNLVKAGALIAAEIDRLQRKS